MIGESLRTWGRYHRLVRHFNAHDPDSRLPCLCQRCFADAPPRASLEGVDFVQAQAVAEGRVLHFWLPADLESVRDQVCERVARRMKHNLDNPTKARPRALWFNHYRLKRTW